MNSLNRIALQTKIRVRKHRFLKKLRSNHEKPILEYIKLLRVGNNDDDALNKTCSPAGDKHKWVEIEEKLKFWVAIHKLTRSAVNELLAILKFSGLNFLPCDSRTLMKTPVNVPIKDLSNGQLWYHGIENNLTNIFNGITKDLSITLDFNADGAPIAKSSNRQIWPILASMRRKCSS